MYDKISTPSPSRIDRAMHLADSAVFEYENKGIDTRSDLVEHSDRVVGQVEAFAGSLLPPLAKKVATKLHDVIDRFWNNDSHKHTPERALAAKECVLRAINDMGLSEEEEIYLLAQLNDLIGVENASGAHRRATASRARTGSVSNGLPREIVEIISDSYKGHIPSKAWMTTEPYLDFDHMHDMLNSTNIEAFVIKACELVDNMQHPSSLRESALLQDVLEAESFYAPILEVLGFDGLASVLRSLSHMVRLKKHEEAKARERLLDSGLVDDGEEDRPDGIKCIEQAKQMVDRIEQIGVENIAKHIFGDNRSLIQPAVGEGADGNIPVHIGDLLVDWEGNKIDFGHYRLKTVGSLANKLYQKKGVLPMDIMGMTVVSEDVSESAQAFAMFIKDRLDNEQSGLRAKKADSKDQPFYVQGSEEYVAAVLDKLRSMGVDETRIQAEPEAQEVAETRGHNTLQVSKITFMALVDGIEVPTEVQFVTKSERERMRTGDIAHIIYKYIKQLGDDISPDERKSIISSAVKVIKAMHARKQHLNPDSLEINERSLKGACEMLYALSA